MKGKAIIPLVLGLCVGLVAVKLLVDTLKKAQASNASKQTITAVIAKQDIDAFTEIRPEMVDLVTTADNRFAPSQDRISKVEGAIKRVTAKGIPQGAPVLLSMLAPEGTHAGMEGRIPAGFRAVSVEIDEVTGVAYQMKPGDWVDVIVVMDVDAGGSKRSKETIAEVILQHVQVAAIGQATAGKPGEGASKVKAAKSATLLVPEEDVPKLHLAQTRGKITLAMRGDDTDIRSVAASSTFGDLLTSMRSAQALAEAGVKTLLPIPTPAAASKHVEVVEAKPIEPPHSVAVYRGSAMPAVQPFVQTTLFESKTSSKILDISDGPVNHAAGMMTAPGGTRQQPFGRQRDKGQPAPVDIDNETKNKASSEPVASAAE